MSCNSQNDPSSSLLIWVLFYVPVIVFSAVGTMIVLYAFMRLRRGLRATYEGLFCPVEFHITPHVMLMLAACTRRYAKRMQILRRSRRFVLAIVLYWIVAGSFKAAVYEEAQGCCFFFFEACITPHTPASWPRRTYTNRQICKRVWISNC